MPFKLLSILLQILLIGVSVDASDAEQSAWALQELQTILKGQPKALANIAAKPFATVPLTKMDAATARNLLWKYQAAWIRKERAREMKQRIIRDNNLLMPIHFHTYGLKPAAGRSLWISLHGGGACPKVQNDWQWENQKRLYTLPEGIYLAPRAPTDTWNQWHEPHLDRLLSRLIENFIVFEKIDPNRVYLLGCSSGGDGVYQLAPRLADHWAAAAMMAGHPNGVSLLSLRNLPFALQVGAEDFAFNRNQIGQEYGQQLAALRRADPAGYEHFVKIHQGKGHRMDHEDRLALPWMASFTRNPIPKKVVWQQTGVLHDRFYWLGVPITLAQIGSLITVTRSGQVVEVTTATGVS